MGIPDTCLHLTDMGTAHHQHTKTGLTDTTTDGQGQLVIQKHLMERKLTTVITTGLSQLTIQGLCVNTNAH